MKLYALYPSIATEQKFFWKQTMTEEAALYTPQDVIDLRNEIGCSLMEAKRIFDIKMLVIEINNMKNIENLKPVLLKIVTML